MLKLKFTHRYYHKVIRINGLPLRQNEHTYFVDCCVVDELDEDLIEYDTKYYPPGMCFDREAKYFKLKPGPYLVIFLKTVTDGYKKEVFYWTTIRTPWCRVKKCCETCANWQSDICVCSNDPPENWIGKVPAKYCEALGQEVQIVYEGEEQDPEKDGDL